MGEGTKRRSRSGCPIGFEALAPLLAVLVALAALPGGVRAQAETDSASLREFVEAYQDAINARDAAALATLFSTDADLVMGDLPALRGRAGIEGWWRDHFARLAPERRATFEVVAARLLSADVALMNVAATSSGTRAGEALPERKGRGTWLLRRGGDAWLIAAMRVLPTERDSVELVSTMEAVRTLRPGLRAFVAAYEDAFNRHDPAGVAAFYTDDADIVVRTSPVLRGRQAILDWWRAYFSERRPSPLARESWYESMRALLIVDEIRMMAPDVALLEISATATARQPEARPSPVRYARATWVVVREDGTWRIAALRVLPSEDDRVVRRASDRR